MLKHVHQTSSSGLSSPNGSVMGSPSRSSVVGTLSRQCSSGDGSVLDSSFRHFRRRLPARDTLSIDSSVSGMSSVDSSSPTPLCDISSTCSASTSSHHEPLSSRSSSSSSLNHEVASILRHIYNKSPPTTTIKVFAKVLRSDIEYKTLSITYGTTSKDLVKMLLNKYRMKHRDPNLFFLTMEVNIRKTGTPMRTVLILDEEAKPAQLQACHPPGQSKFMLQIRRGGLIKIFDGCLMPGSLYKSLLISDRTSVDEVIEILFQCYNLKEQVRNYTMYEVCTTGNYERKLHSDDYPLVVQQEWANSENFSFVLKRNFSSDSHRKRAWSESDTLVSFQLYI